jgi:dihydrodipicolinate synthase/N-acetylneuraminate lyase
VVESIMVGATGWVSGLSNAFLREGETLFRLARAGRYDEAMKLFRWFMSSCISTLGRTSCSASSSASTSWDAALI